MAGEDDSVTKMVGMIKNIHTPMNTTKEQWDRIFHKDEDCPVAKRPEGCSICEQKTKEKDK